jgi:transposase
MSAGIYPASAVERAMKVEEVLMRATAGKIMWWQAAEMIGISARQLRRWRKRYEDSGYDGLLDRRRGVPSRKRVPKAQAEQVLDLYREQYFDLNVRHFHEKLREEHQIGLSYTWVKQALQGAGLVKRKSKRGVHRKRRERRPLPGMMLHIDGSHHQWFQDERWHDLIVILDDATSEIYYAQLVEEETTTTDWMIYQTGHFTCLENRTFLLAKDTDGLAVIRSERLNDEKPTCTTTCRY